jgi:hypothetical protein
MSDKRGQKRIARAFVMRVAVDDGNPWPKWSLVTTGNVSAGGALFVFDQPVKKGQLLYCKLHFLDRLIDCRARVARLTPGFQKPLLELAVIFEWESEKDRLYLEEFSKNLPSSG